MNSIYAQKQTPVQQKTAPIAASVLDDSTQSDELQRKADLLNNAVQRAEAPRPNNTGMPDNLKSGIESLSGFSMDDVRVHYNSSKPATVQALAYTQGTDIHVAPSQEKHLPHEAWHVAQQMAGRVSPTTNINGMPVNDNAALEHEADVMGEKAVQMKSDESKTVQRATIRNGVAQRVELENYYYHISQSGIPESKSIDPRHAINTPSSRNGRGDDLGPGFYMGDFNFLPYYYRNNFITSKKLYIYYIEKELINSTLEQNFKDFTLKEKTGFDPDKLFQIAMQLGFRYVDENDVTNHQRPLDLLDPDKTDESDPDIMEKFKNCVDEIYRGEATGIFNFFKDANSKAIWKGYLNDIDQQEMENLTITKNDITEFFQKCGIYENIVKGLEDTLPTDFSNNMYDTNLDISTKNIQEKIYGFVEGIYDLFKKQQPISEVTEANIADYFINCEITKDVAKGLAKALPKKVTNDKEVNLSARKDVIQFNIYTFVKEKYNAFLQQKKHYIYKSLGTNEDKPIQIAIRKDIKYKENNGEVSLLEKIKGNVIPFTEDDFTQRDIKTEGIKSKEGIELKNKLKLVLAKERGTA